MNIWVLTNEYEGNIIGGLGIAATQIARSISPLGNQVTVICHKKSSGVTVEYENQVRVIRFPFSSAYFTKKQLFRAGPIARWLQNNKIGTPDLIHVHSLQCVQLAKHLKRKFQVPVVYTCHSLISRKSLRLKSRISRIRQRKLIRLSDGITVPSAWQKMQLQRFYPDLKKPVQVIHHGTILPKDPGTRKYNRRLLFVGRLHPVKGLKELLGAIALLKNKYKVVKLDIVGNGSKKYKSKLAAYVNRLGIHRNVNWLGKLKPEEVRKLYPSYSAVVVPSKSESFGLVALEVMASGTPLVATRRGGLASFVNPNNAEIIRRVEPAGIARSIGKVWNNPGAAAEKVNRAKHTASRFDWQSSAEKYVKFFEKIRSAPRSK